MKKLVLASLLVAFAVSGANAANIIDGNPLYRPGQGRFYSLTSVGSNSESANDWVIGEEFGYGITKELAVVAKTTLLGILEDNGDADNVYWQNLDLGLNYRVLDKSNWKTDVYGNISANQTIDHWWTENNYFVWTLGVRGGYVADNWTVAGHFAFDYLNDGAFEWGDKGAHRLRAGIDGQYLIDSNWNLVAGVEYAGITDDSADHSGTAGGTFGVNYNFDQTKFIGLYASKEMADSVADGWKFVKGFGFGAKFAIDF